MIAASGAGARGMMLMRFDLSSLAGMTINSVTLSLFNATTQAVNLAYAVHAILAANSTWSETECSWNLKASTPSAARWAGDTGADGGADAGCSVSGTDYSATALGTFNYVSGTAIGTEHAVTLDAAAIQALIASGNYGFVIVMTTPGVNLANYAWATSDHATTGYRPKLVVDYTTGVTGSLSSTLGALTLSAAGTVVSADVTGELTQTLAALTLESAGTVAAGTGIVGELTATMGDVTLTASGAHGTLYVDGDGGNVTTAADVNLHQTAATYNGGVHDAIQFGNYNYALIRFDLSAIPAGSSAISAKLSLGLYEGGGSADIYAVLAANAGWIEGTRNLQLALSGEPCWNALAADGSGGITTAWAGGSNGCGVAGTDITASPIGTLSAASAGVHEVDLDLTTVAGWFGAANPGILIKPTSSSPYHIALSEYTTASYRPKLSVLYAAATERTGALNQTLDALTVSASGTVAITGEAAPTLGDVTLTASGRVAITGAASITLTGLTLAATIFIGVIITPASRTHTPGAINRTTTPAARLVDEPSAVDRIGD